MNRHDYLTDDARNQETACQRPGVWLVEGYTIERKYGTWAIYLGNERIAPRHRSGFRTLTAARNWLVDHLRGAQ